MNTNQYQKLAILDGIEVLKANHCKQSFPLHRHDTYNISLILENTFHTELQDRSLMAPVGAIAITNPDELHATPCDPDIGNSFFTFYVPPSIIEFILGSKDMTFEDKTICDQQIFQELLILADRANLNEVSFEKAFVETLKKLLLKYELHQMNKKSKGSLAQFIKDIIADDERFSVKTICSRYGINQYKLIRLFKQETGLTPKHFFLLRRIEKSKTLLRAGHPIFDVALDCGFYDAPHFYKYFKQYTGVNPSDFQAAFVKQ